MNKVLFKRLSFFTNIYLILFGISVLILINKFDADDSRKELEALTVLEKINDTDPNKYIKDFNNSVFSWLCKHHKNTCAQHEQTRKTLVKILTETYGVDQYEIDGAKRNTDETSFGLIDFKFHYDSLKTNVLVKSKENEEKVSNAIRYAQYLSSPLQITVSTQITEDALKKAFDQALDIEKKYKLFLQEEILEEDDTVKTTLEEFRSRQLSRAFNLQRVRLVNDSCEVYLKWGARNSQTGYAPTLYVKIHSTIERIEAPSILEIMGKSNRSTAMFQDRAFCAYLTETYGELDLDKAITMAATEANKNYNSVSLFGFNFSRKRLPSAIMFFCFVATMGTYIVLAKASAKKLPIISTTEDEGFVAMLMEYKWMRFNIFCVLPCFILYLTFPEPTRLISFSHFVSAFVLFLLLFMGAINFFRSNRL